MNLQYRYVRLQNIEIQGQTDKLNLERKQSLLSLDFDR